MRKFVLAGICVLLLTWQPAPHAQTRSKKDKGKAASVASQFGNVEAVTADQLRSYLYYVASDEMEGRDTGSRGHEATLKFIALNLHRWGLQPAGDHGTYFQDIKLVNRVLDNETSTITINGQEFKMPAGAFLGRSAGRFDHFEATGELVFVGNGFQIPEKEIDPYKGIDVKGKILVTTSGLPKGVAFQEIRAKLREVEPAAVAGRLGAKAVLALPNYSEAISWDPAGPRRGLSGQGQLSLAAESETPQQTEPVPLINLSPAAARALFANDAVQLGSLGRRIENNEPGNSIALNSSTKVSITLTVKSEPRMTHNVVAILEGSDPVLKKEYVALGAHSDHVGVNPPGINGDAIYNGADDDGSGTVTILSIAEALAKGPKPKRSVLFVWHTGEEKGLWGSRYFTDHPEVPLDKVITQLNIDMIGRSKKDGDTNPLNRELSGPDTIYVIGSGMMSDDLRRISESVNQSFLKLTFDYKYDDPKDPNRFFYRSDHFNYAKHGVPIIFFFDGVHEDYHRPSDSPDKIDYTKMEKVARTVFATMWTLANAPARPKADRPLPKEFGGQ